MVRKTLKEMKTILTGVFKSFGIKHEELKVPKELYKKGIGLELFRFSITILGLVFSYMLKLTNVMIEMRLIILGIVFFMLYYGEQIINSTLNLVNSAKETKYQFLFDNTIILSGSKILFEVSGKVQRKDEKTKVYSMMSNETIINVIKRYLNQLWHLKIRRTFNILEMVTTILMLVVAILTNDVIDQRLFIPAIVIFAILSFVVEAYIAVLRTDVHEKNRMYFDQRDEITNDVVRNEPIVKQDIPMRISLLSQIISKNNDNVIDFDKKRNMSRLIMCVVETLATYGIILLYIFGVNWNEISVATIAGITANIVIVTSALNKISGVAHRLDRFNEMVTVINREEQDMKLIIEAYDKSVNWRKDSKEVNEIIVPSFQISYMEESENDKPFTLKSNNDIKLSKGDVAILYGSSGSGKSTFMKLLTERISVEKNVEIPSTSRFLYYDERLRFGSLNVYSELFCNIDTPNVEKMKEILINLNLWHEISTNCIDVWQYLKEKKYNHFSNGQKQRLILAKMLYWLDSSIDVIVLDECTSGLDDISSFNDGADAQRILEYIVKYSNRDKQRIIVISTHQNIDKFISSVQNEFNIQKFHFIKQETCNVVE